MRRYLRRVDPGFLVVLAISLIALWPFLSRASLPEGTDAELHIFRLAELSGLLRGGEFYPRWAPNFYHGFGYPIFNYYAPLTYYLGFVVDLLPRVDPVGAVKAIFVLGMLLSAFGMYGFVRDNWGRRAGYVAAAVFIYAPYLQYIDPHARGVLPESFSFGIFAIALWALDRLLRQGTRRPWLVAVLSVAAVIMAHNLMGLLFFGLLAGWALWRIVLDRGEPVKRETAVRRLLPALSLGLGAAAIFWLPVFLERDLVNLSTLIGRQDNYDFHTHFLSMRELLAPSLRLDWGASEPAFRFNLGVGPWLLGGLGVALLVLRKVRHPRHVTFFVAALVVLLFLMLPASTFVWETLPFLPYFQFPWRLLGATAAMLAVLAGAGTEAVLRVVNNERVNKGPWRSPAAWITAGFVALLLLLGLPLSQPAPWSDFGEVNNLRMTLIENTGRWLGTTSTADYVPATVESLPQRKGSVVANFGLGLPLDRVNREMLPEGTLIEGEQVRPLHTRYTIDLPRATRLRLFLFDFPGWQVRIDGQPAQTELGKPEGFLVIPVPAGAHVIDVRFGSTPARTAAMLISAVALLLMVVAAWQLPTGPGPQPARPFADGPVLAVVLGIFVLFALVLNPSGVLHFDSKGWEVEPAQQTLFADFGEQVALLGFDLPRSAAETGDTLDVTLYWKAQDDLDINYQVFVHLLGADGLAAQSDKINPGDFPTRRWPVDKYVRDAHRLLIPADLPPGDYILAAGVWVQSEGWRLPLLDVSGQQVGDSVALGTIRVE